MNVKGIIEPNGDVIWTAPVIPGHVGPSARLSYVAIVGDRTVYGTLAERVYGTSSYYYFTGHGMDHTTIVDTLTSEFGGLPATDEKLEEVNRAHRAIVRRFVLGPCEFRELFIESGTHATGLLTLADIRGTPTLGEFPCHIRKFMNYYTAFTEWDHEVISNTLSNCKDRLSGCVIANPRLTYAHGIRHRRNQYQR